MKLRKIKLKVISPINYYHIQGGRIERPANFIGDIALKYSLLHQLGLGNFFEVSSFKPNYSELKSYNFWFTVGVTQGFEMSDFSDTPRMMKPMIRNTMQGIDFNGSNEHPNINVGSIMFKNFYMQQFIKPGNSFFAYLLDGEGINLPSALRIGTGKVGVLEVSEEEDHALCAFINLYTVKNILGRDEIYQKMSLQEFEYSEHIALPYYIVGPIRDISTLADIYGY